MSVKGKNLSYEAQEPSFLRRLRAQQSGLDNDRHERPLARPKRVAVDDGDDGPTYVDETSNQALSKDEYEALVSGNAEPATQHENKGSAADTDNKPDGDAANVSLADAETSRKKQNVTEVGKSQKKRKIAKAVATDDVQAVDESKSKSTPKPKKKAKGVKLSFGNEQD